MIGSDVPTLVPVDIAEIDPATVPGLRARLDALDPTDHVALDLAGVEFIDSTGLRTLVAARNRHVAAGGSLRVVNAGRQVRRLIEVMRLGPVLGSDGDARPQAAG